MIKVNEATLCEIDLIAELWSKLMVIHKMLDVNFFSKGDEFIDQFKIDLENFVKSDLKKVYSAKFEDKLVGFVTAEFISFANSNSIYNNHSYIIVDDIMIDENFQHMGIGKSLLLEVKDWGQKLNINYIETNVFSQNTKAYTFFKNQGFDDLFVKLKLKTDTNP